MAVWNGTVTTQLGLNLIAKVIAGKTNLAFTKLQTSEGNYTSSNLVGMTSLLNVKQEFNVSNVSVQNATTVLVKGIITNTGLSNQYNLNAIGLFATDPDLGEILFSVTTADTADIIPAKTNTNTTSLIVNILTSVTDSSKVTLTLAQPGLVTTDMLDTALTTYIKNTDNATESVAGIVKISTTAQVSAGTDNTTAVSPAKLREAFANLKATNGYQKLSNGAIIQWGSLVTNDYSQTDADVFEELIKQRDECRVKIKRSGSYLISGFSFNYFYGSTTPSEQPKYASIVLEKNGTVICGARSSNMAGLTNAGVTLPATILDLAPGDIVRIKTYGSAYGLEYSYHIIKM